ncbi:carboxypeptidase-like regulatory domain-containing protein, partial [Hymenobacter sp. AT01-02]|uniref:carboxypeptidase-like regulatory domain-containing protein n=1 Tax=Hymenobacter sp. AT01-02 TaxID=1571877 RepID=UPI00128EFDF4
MPCPYNLAGRLSSPDHSTTPYACTRSENQSSQARRSSGADLIGLSGPALALPVAEDYDNSPVQSATAVDQVVSGRVADKAGQPLPGVTVLVKGTTTGTTTDSEGRFQLTVANPAQAVLVVSFIGYQTQELRVAEQSSLELVLKESATGLDEVVVIGYGTAKRENITTAVATLPNPEKIANRPLTNVQDMLQGNLAGVTVVQNGGDPAATARVVIRGAGTLSSEAPLYVVDGMPYYGGPLNPNDIASITVLKDAASAAVYGAQASSGVIVVTTKSGKSGAPRITIDTYRGWQTAHQTPEALNAAEQAAAYNQAAD